MPARCDGRLAREVEGTGWSHDILKAAVKTQSPGTAREIQRHLAAEFGPTWLEEDLT